MQQDQRDSERGPIVDVAWLQGHRDTPGLRIVDVRSLGNYLMGHIAGAVQLDINAIRLSDSSETGIAGFLNLARVELRRIGIQPDDQVVFYEDFSGASAARGVWMLDAVGHRGGAMLDGGLRAWLHAGERLTRDTPQYEPSRVAVTLDRTVLATAEEIVAALDAGTGLDIVDSRNDTEFLSGTIPTSIHLEWTHHLAPDGTFLPVAELRAMYDRLGITAGQERPVVTVCGSGYRAAHTYVVLKTLGVPEVRNYAPSWGEWGRRSDLPVEVPRYR